MGKYKFYVGVALMMCAVASSAQESQLYDSEFGLLQKARNYFESGDYAVSSDFLKEWNRSDAAARQDATVKEEIEFMEAAFAADKDPAAGREALLAFLARNPQSDWNNHVRALLGIACAQSDDFKQAIEWFDQSDVYKLTIDESRRMEFYRAVSYIKSGRVSEGYVLLSALDQVKMGDYSEDIDFYKAYADYAEGRMDAARQGFSKRYRKSVYEDWSALYLAEIAMRDGNYDEAMRLARAVESNGNSTEVCAEAERVMGEVAFMQQNWQDASELLESYISTVGVDNSARLDLYQLGMSKFQTGDFAMGPEFLGKDTDKEDELAQNAWLHMGLSSLECGDTAQALFQFERAASMTANRSLTEQALYNYVMSVQDAGGALFADPVAASERFLNDFPNSAFRSRVSERLVDVYMQSTNYDAALASIEKIHNPDNGIQKARQQLLYNRGIELYANGRYADAADYLGKAIGMTGCSSQVAADASFWRAESYFRMAKAGRSDYFRQAYADYYKYTLMTTDNRLYGQALYGAGYASYNMSDWDNAVLNWKILIGKYSKGVSDEVLADACSRLGDCYFYDHDYSLAEEYYGKSLTIWPQGGDYPLFRTGLCKGLRKDYKGKADVMERLCKDYPASSYCAPALYEEARAFVEMDQSQKAIDAYNRLASDYPKSDLARKALAETALIYYQNDDYDKAIPAYRKVIENYPGSDEAAVAMRDLRSVYVETGKVDQYIAYAGKTAGMAPVAADEKDSLTYTSAELLFTKGSYKSAGTAFEKYLSAYPQGAYRTDANYYLGLINLDGGDKAKALENLLAASRSENSRFCTESLERASSLAYELGQYSTALDAYTRLNARAGSAAQTRAALVGIVRSAYAAGEYGTVVANADKALESSIDGNMLTEIRYDKAKSLQQLGRQDEAFEEFGRIADNFNTAFGAESSYLISQMLFDRKNLEGAEQNIRKMISAGTPHRYWLARSFVLLSDIYTAQGKSLEAKQYLLSLKQNYTAQDDIAAMIDERLTKLDNN